MTASRSEFCGQGVLAGRVGQGSTFEVSGVAIRAG